MSCSQLSVVGGSLVLVYDQWMRTLPVVCRRFMTMQLSRVHCCTLTTLPSGHWPVLQRQCRQNDLVEPSLAVTLSATSKLLSCVIGMIMWTFTGKWLNVFCFITGPPAHIIGDQYCFALWRLSSSSVVACNIPRSVCRRLHPSFKR